MNKIFTIILLFLLISTKSFSQCCSAGNPLGGDGSHEGLNKNELTFFTSFKYSISKYYYFHDSKTEIPNVEKSYYDYQNLTLSYGISSRLSIKTELGYFYDKTQVDNINNEEILFKSKGLGDLGFTVRYTIIKTFKPQSQLVLSGGTKIPIGAFNEDINGVTVPIALQPSSGALKFNGSVFYSRKRADRKLGWNTYLLFEASNTINQGYLVYKYGNLMQYSLAATYSFNKQFNFLLNSKFEWRAHDKRENETIIESTGSKVVFLNPQLIYTIKSNWSVLAMLDIPVYKYVNGYQLTNQFSLQFGLRKVFNS